MPELRPYQQQAVDAVYDHLRRKDTNPCVVLPTGTGKSLVLGKIAGDAVTLWNGRVLILAHGANGFETHDTLCTAVFPSQLSKRDFTLLGGLRRNRRISAW